ncbi:MAG: glutamate-5-semialdehyde dehydrogenase [Kiritimatiellia bacterium]|nr:glutamate-5-semialdehyde dehydrogenase [Kiritimatiellia bacterium]
MSPSSQYQHPYDAHFIELALREADRAAQDGEVPTACIIVKTPNNPNESPDNIPILAIAHNQTEHLRQATAHAEILAINQASSQLGDWRLGGCTAYVTKEPCPMCAGALVLARLDRVVWGLPDSLRGGQSHFSILADANLNHHPQYLGGVHETNCRNHFQTFFQNRRRQCGKRNSAMTLAEQIRTIAQQAQKASRQLATLSTRKKNAILEAMANELQIRKAAIQAINKKDVEAARKAGLSEALIDRLTLTDTRYQTMVEGIRTVAALKDPVGQTVWKRKRPNGMVIAKKRTPIGVIAIIYESRPNVTADASVLCIKTGNAVILRGGKECLESNAAIAQAMAEGGTKAGLPEFAFQFINIPGHEAVTHLVQSAGLIDVVIPRGGERLIRAVTEQARIPVLKHYNGICHVYVDDTANVTTALKVIENSKCQRPSACNAAECLLIHKDKVKQLLPKLAKRLAKHQVVVHADTTCAPYFEQAIPLAPSDYGKEYLSQEVNILAVDDLDQAIKHINTYGSHHSDAILTQTPANAKRFLAQVDSSAVFENCSTRFNDGGEFGMGAEMGISTDKLHARGPMGLEELTSYKYIVTGNGQIRG